MDDIKFFYDFFNEDKGEEINEGAAQSLNNINSMIFNARDSVNRENNDRKIKKFERDLLKLLKKYNYYTYSKTKSSSHTYKDQKYQSDNTEQYEFER